MTKRPHSELASGPSTGDGDHSTSKRLKVPDALSLLTDHSEELIACLQSLRGARGRGVDERLLRLSKTLLPAWKALGKASGANEDLPPREEPTDAQGAVAVAPAAASSEAPSGRNHRAVSLTKWEPSDIPRLLPPLPPVLDPVYEQAAFTHAGVVSDRQGLNYERLEWIGDAYIYLMSSGFIWQTFQSLPPGRCAQLREVLVRNMTLGDYSIQYGLDKRASFTEEFGQGGRHNGTTAKAETRKKVLGDLFEAYTAAVILSDPANGLARASEWLKALWSKTLASEITRESRRQRLYSGSITLPALEPSREGPAPSAPSTAAAPRREAEPAPDVETAKVRLAAAIGVKGVAIRYKDKDSAKQKKDKLTGLPLFTVEVVVDGWGEKDRSLGFGTAPSKKEAGAKAALMALQNKALMKFYGEKKARFLAVREAQQAEAGVAQPK